MAPRLSPVLSPADLPEAELHAAKLDGELFAVGDCFSPVDEAIGPQHRVRALAAMLPIPLPTPLIAEQHTAAWVLGVTDAVPPRPELCTDSGARARPAATTLLGIREVVIDGGEFSWLGGMRVTTPLRTAIDLARFSTSFCAQEREIIRRLAGLGGFCFTDCVEAIEARRNLPRKHRAQSRLVTVFAA